MKEALSIIASAFSCMFIALFLVLWFMPINHMPKNEQEQFAVVWLLVLLPLAVAGSGWLYYQHTVHEKANTEVRG